MQSVSELRDWLYPPVAIGGVGGSGTRLIATILQKLGFHMGSDLNEANDNLAFTLLFKRTELWPIEQNKEEIQYCLEIFLNAMLQQDPWRVKEVEFVHSLVNNDRPQHPFSWLVERAVKLINSGSSGLSEKHWGWKEPNTHILMPALFELLPNMKYIHVMRHGLDMAYSSNQNQLQFWGTQLLGESALRSTPANSFRYWCAAHRRIRSLKETMGENFLLLDFDELCLEPEKGLNQLMAFLQIDIDRINLPSIKELISPPPSMGRYKTQPKTNVSVEDLNFLQELGYSYYP